MNKDILNFIHSCDDSEIWKIFALSKNELKKRGIIRTNNIVGERGEFLAIEIYNNTSGLSNLQAAPEGTQNVDALSRKGERYTIKTMTLPSKTTSIFYGCGDKDEQAPKEKKFEYVIIVLVDKDLELNRMLEINWLQFLKFRKWHKTMRGWNISVTKELVREAKNIL